MSVQIPGIDVSKHNGAIDWGKVAAAGKKYALIRVGWAGYDGRIQVHGGLDSLFQVNMRGALAAGLDVGVYVYAYCKTADAARVAAHEVLALVRPYKLTYPVIFDMEADNTPYPLYTPAQNTAIAKGFLKSVEEAGYYGMLYTFKSFALSKLNMQELAQYDFWLAHHVSKTDYPGNYGIWQHHGDAQKDKGGNVTYPAGSCAGVNGACDLNTAYKDYAKLIRTAGLNNLVKEESPKTEDAVPLYEFEELSRLYDELLADKKRADAEYDELARLYGQLLSDSEATISLAEDNTAMRQEIAELAAKWAV